MVVNQIIGFILDGKSYSLGYANSQPRPDIFPGMIFKEKRTVYRSPTTTSRTVRPEVIG